jgi:hypothetical protein
MNLTLSDKTLTITCVSWADATHLIGAFVYKTFDETDFATQFPKVGICALARY